MSALHLTKSQLIRLATSGNAVGTDIASIAREAVIREDPRLLPWRVTLRGTHTRLYNSEDLPALKIWTVTNCLDEIVRDYITKEEARELVRTGNRREQPCWKHETKGYQGPEFYYG